MALDGFSMKNVGLVKDPTSAQRAQQTEQLIAQGKNFNIKSISEASSDKAVKLDEERLNRQAQEEFKDGFDFSENEENNQDDENDEALYQDKLKLLEETLPNGIKIRFNNKNEMIELFDTTTQNVVENITPNDLVALVSKLDYGSGVLVNREI